MCVYGSFLEVMYVYVACFDRLIVMLELGNLEL